MNRNGDFLEVLGVDLLGSRVWDLGFRVGFRV